MLRSMLLAAAAAAITFSSSAFAACPASNRYTLNFATSGAQQLDYATSYTATVTNPRGQSLTMGLAFSTFNLASNQFAGQTMPQISNIVNDGGTTNNNLIIAGVLAGRTTDVSANSRVVVTRFTFATPIRDFTIQVNDIDFTTNQFRDWIQINGINGASNYDPAITTPHGNSNASGGQRSATNSTLLLGPSSTPLSLTTRQAGGLSANPNNANGGTITAEFAAPVTEVDVRYGNFPFSSGENTTGQQAIGIQSVSFCPMPQLTVTKSSAPQSTAAADPNRFTIPDADVVYAVTVSNSDTSPVDLDALILTDILPPAITFRNSDFDDSGPVLTNFEFVPGTTGLSMAAADIAFSNNGGSSYGYAAAAGYDAAINAIRLNPKGQMAANSSFTVRFRARIK
jgi:uncharacterized repeat protein (TIGR01451 family)